MVVEKVSSTVKFRQKSTIDLQNFKQAQKNNKILNNNNSTNFTGLKVPKKPAKDFTEFILRKMSLKVRGADKIHSGMGEFQNQLINAAGTGLVAPIFIKYNPLSKRDKDTRTYTAWRQPISAVLAIATQGAIVIPFNKLIKEAADIGFLGVDYNSSLFPSRDYLEAQVKEQNPGIKYSKDEMEKLVDAKGKEYSKALQNMISNDEIVYKQTNMKGEVSSLRMNDEEFKNLFAETLDSIMNKEEIEKNATSDKLAFKVKRGNFYRAHSEESRKILEHLETTLNRLDESYGAEDAAKTCEKFGKECKKLIKEIKKSHKTLESKKVGEELIKMVKEVQGRILKKDGASLPVLRGKLSHMLEELSTMEKMKSTQDVHKYVLKKINRRTDAIDGVIETLSEIKSKLMSRGITVQEAQSIIDEKVTASKNALTEKLKKLGIAPDKMADNPEFCENLAARLEQKVGKIAKAIGEQLKKHKKANQDALKRYTGLTVSLAILPVTCWLLNKIYPWFMDLAFPKLSNKAATQKAKKTNTSEQNKEVK